VNLNE
jgi:hypothetical protein